MFIIIRIDAAKHMWPSDLEVIQNELNDLNEDWFPTGSKPFVYLEVIDQNNPDEVRLDEYTHLGRWVFPRWSLLKLCPESYSINKQNMVVSMTKSEFVIKIWKTMRNFNICSNLFDKVTLNSSFLHIKSSSPHL